ncbi:hypothetical protein [Marinicella meishanensis]|uniref:hypothetical protein n=1 Tax=Marinicella meishanensis TaxID=2873263 RepID=UPI001CBB689A|nr:hypothetical protein [Marinicella sp. NBU2979]
MPFLDLSAFLSASNYWNSELSDTNFWPKKSFIDSIKEVFKGLSLASGISREGLHIDAVELLELMSSDDSFDTQMAMFYRTIHIDIEPNWDLIQHSDLDSKKIVKAMFSDSKWITWLAGNLVLKLHDSEGLIRVIKRLIKDGGYTTLLITSYMVHHLNNDEKIKSIILNRLKGKLIPGCQFLYTSLSRVNITFDKNVMNAISRGLFKSGPITAKEAAKFAGKFHTPVCEQLYKTLNKAFNYWAEKEGAYPADGGAEPDSPRAELLAALLKMKIPSENELISFLSDPRWDVREVAEVQLNSSINENTSLREKLIIATNEEVVDPVYLSKAIRSNTAFDILQIDAICEMINHKSAKVRYAAFNVLNSKYISDEKLRTWLEVAINDTNEEISEAAVLRKSRL